MGFVANNFSCVGSCSSSNFGVLTARPRYGASVSARLIFHWEKSWGKLIRHIWLTAVADTVVGSWLRLHVLWLYNTQCHWKWIRFLAANFIQWQVNMHCPFLMVISKEAVGNSTDTLNAILGHRYHLSHSNRIMSSEWSQHLQQRWVWLQFVRVKQWVSTRSLVCRHQHSGSVHCFSENRSRSNVWKAHMHTERHKHNKSHFMLQILGLFALYDPVWIMPMVCVT